jgi:hypothetical protein
MTRNHGDREQRVYRESTLNTMKVLACTLTHPTTSIELRVPTPLLLGLNQTAIQSINHSTSTRFSLTLLYVTLHRVAWPRPCSKWSANEPGVRPNSWTTGQQDTARDQAWRVARHKWGILPENRSFTQILRLNWQSCGHRTKLDRAVCKLQLSCSKCVLKSNLPKAIRGSSQQQFYV